MDKRNVIIYVDYENIHKIELAKKQNLLRLGFFEKIRKWAEVEKLRILDIKVYCNFDTKDLYESKHQTKLQEYGVETYHTSNKGKNYSDLKIAVDLLEELYENSNVDGFILVSNDKDMTPLIKTIKRYKQFVYLVTDDDSFDDALVNFPDKHILLSDIFKNESELQINKVETAIMESLDKYLNDKLYKYKKDKSTMIHNGIDYYINNSFSHFNIFKYEFANILKVLYEKKKIILYNYDYKGSKMTALTIDKLTIEYMKEGVFKEEDKIDDYDFAKTVDKIYEEYISKNS